MPDPAGTPSEDPEPPRCDTCRTTSSITVPVFVAYCGRAAHEGNSWAACEACGGMAAAEKARDAHEAACPAAPWAPTSAPVTARSDPELFLYDADRLGEFVARLRASGVKSFRHPSGLEFSFEPAAKMPIRPAEGW